MPVTGHSIESLQLSFGTGSPTELNFKVGVVNLPVRRLIINTDSDVYLNFDGAADSSCFILTPGCGQISIDNIIFTTMSAMGVNGAGNLYILALRN